MLALDLIRNNPDQVKDGLAAKGDMTDLTPIMELDKEYRSLLNEGNELRAKRNRASETIADLKRNGKDADSAIQAMRELSQELKSLENQTSQIKESLNHHLLRLPNLPQESVPIGQAPADNVLIRDWGTFPQFNFNPRTHLELGNQLGLFDFKRAAKISGSGFPLYTGPGAKLERALLNFMLDVHVDKFNFTEVFPPFMVRSEAALTCGLLPKFEEEMYQSEKDTLWLIPTAEVPVTNIHRDEILPEEALPKNYVAYSACFRREAGSYGKETHGFLRLHQFNKIELVKFVQPEHSYQELEKLVVQAEAILQALGLHYRVLELCSGDLSFSAAKCYDLEVWAPGEQKWLEVSSCSNFESFQARRGNIRYRRSVDQKVDFVHTLNGSGVATPRLLVALLETYQQENGSVEIPAVLQPYFGQAVLI